jgi:hypothetical protein
MKVKSINGYDPPRYVVRRLRWSDEKREYEEGEEVASFRFKTHALFFVRAVFKRSTYSYYAPNFTVVYLGRVIGDGTGPRPPVTIENYTGRR